jgi:hypothetical protein
MIYILKYGIHDTSSCMQSVERRADVSLITGLCSLYLSMDLIYMLE